MSENYLNVYSNQILFTAISNYETFGRYSYGYGSNGENGKIDCSHLVSTVFSQNRIQIPYLTTTQLASQQALKYFDVISENDVKPGDLVLFEGHVGFVESYNGSTKTGRFFGSQSSTGPATSNFTVNSANEYWGKDRKFVKVLRPKESLIKDAYTQYCFPSGTPILMSDGTYKSIERIKIDDEVMAFDGLGELEPRRVTQTFVTPDCEVVQLGEIRVTHGHHFLQPDGSFKALGEIDQSGFLVGVTGKLISHPGSKIVEGKHTVYNFTVEDLHTYVAGDYRVHNESRSNYEPVTTAGFIGASIGSQIGSHFANDKFVSQLIAQSLGKYTGGLVGDVIAYEVDPSLSQESLSLAAIYDRLPSSFVSTGVSLISSDIASYVIKSLKVKDPLAQIGITSLTSAVVSYYFAEYAVKRFGLDYAINNLGVAKDTANLIASGGTASQGIALQFGKLAAGAVGAYLGAQTYQLLIKWNVIGENVSTEGVKVGGSIGALGGAYYGAKIGSAFGPWGTVIGAGIGAFLGVLQGSIFGGAFGDKDYPRAFASVIVVNNQFVLTPVAVDDKGSYDIAYNMGNAAKDFLTLIVGLTEGKPISIRNFQYGHYLKDYVYRPQDVGLGAYDYPYRFSSPQDAITTGILQQVQSVQIEGGDLYVKRILSALPSDVKTLEQLNIIFQVAKEWGIYRDNSVLYDQNINYLKANAIKDADAKIIDLRSRPTEAFDPKSQSKYFGNALKFDGNDYVAFQSSVAPTGNQSYTIEAWVKPDKTGALGIVGWGTYGKSNAVNGLKLEADGIRNYWQDNDIKAAIKVSLNEWHHIAANYDSATGIRKIYLDGQKVAEGRSSSPNIATNSNFTIGKTFDQEYFSGQIDDVRVWNVARTDDQIAAQMNRQLKGNETGLVGYWNLNEGKGTAVQDLTASNKLGVIQGANWVPYDAKLRDFDINVLPSQIQLSLQGNNLFINGEIIPNWLTTSDRLETLRFADGSRFKIVASNGTVRLDDERVANWEEIKTKATQLNLDAAKPSDNYLAPNASQIVINTNSPLLVSKNLTNPNSYTASSSANPSSSPDKAFDGLGTTWNAGGYGNHWIEIDLGEQYQLSSIKLKVEQAPSGNTIHEVRISNQPIGASATGATLATTFKGNTVDGQWLSGDFSNSPVGRYVQIKTTQSPSWIAWEEIEVYGKSLTSSIIGNISDDVLIATVSGQTLNGSKGDDIYRYNRGQGIITIKDAGGLDTLEFDASIKSSDLLVQQSGIDLIIALKNLANPSATAAQLTDKVVISNFFNQKIEVIRFGNNQEIAIESLIPSFSVNGIAKPVTTIPNTVTFSNSSYYLTTASSWTNSQAQAKAMGGNLVTINSKAEQDLLFTIFGKNESFWTGLNDAKQEGKFEWVSGEPVTYTNWAAGEPNNNDGNEDYALMWNARGGLWNDGEESTNIRGIVEVNRLLTGNDKGNLYQYRLGDGNEVIYDIGNYEGTTRDGGLDTLEFGAGITLSSLKLTLDNNNLIVKVNDTATITIRDWIKAQSKIEIFRFSDGNEYSPTLSFNGTVSLQATFSAGDPNYNLAADKPEIFATSPYKLATVDLTGDGLQLISAQESMTLSDPDNDTYPEQTGWVAPSDGFLVMDRDNNGVITGLNEFFSLQKQTNVSFLGDLDTNKDLIIDTKDANFQQLRIWTDNNLNGDVELGELSALYRYGINSISVTPQTKNFNVAGNSITASAYFTRIGFETKPVSQLYDVAFTYKRDGLKIEQLASGVSRFNYENKPDIVFADDSGQNINLTIDPNEIYSATGGKGNDIFTVKAGSTKGAVLSGGDGDDHLIGSNGNDILTGGAGRDAIDGGAGDDVITIDKSDDLTKIKGGAGFDVLVIEGDGDVSFTLDNLGVEVVNGNQGNNTLTAIGTQDVIISGNGGNDRITGGQGSDRIEGNEGNDVLNGGAGDDNLNGGTGDDAINGGIGNDTVVLRGKSFEYKFVFNASGSVIITDAVSNRDGQDTLSNCEFIQFSDRNYRISELRDFEQFYRLIHKDVDNEVKAGLLNSGLQHYEFRGKSEGRLTANDFNEQFYRLVNPDVDAAIKANSVSMPSAMYHYLNWGYTEKRATSWQFDEAFYRLIYPSIDAAIKAGTQPSALQHYINHGYGEGRVINLSFDEQYYRSANPDVDAEIKLGKMPSAIHHYINHGYAEGRVAQFNAVNSNASLWGTSNSDVLQGSNGNNYLNGGSGNDKLMGLDGNDTLSGGLGNDTLDGGNGIDTAVYTGKFSEYHVVFYSGFTHVSDTASNRDDTDTLLPNVENVKFSDATLSLAQIRDMGARFSGLEGNDVVTGGKGNDFYVRGNAGDDILNGGAGIDTLIGGTGNDIYIVDSTTDTITELANEGTDTIQSSVTFSLFNLANIENLTLTGTAAINGTGNSANNILTGNSSINILDGKTGADTLIGGLGNDSYLVDNVGDKVIETSSLSTEIDTVQSIVNYTLGANLENLTLLGNTAINGTGNTLNNSITGNISNNTLNGDSGNDILTGAGGQDILTGGLGADRFSYPNFTDSLLAVNDRITDFNPTEGDRIALKSLPSSVFNGGVFSNSTLSGAISAAYTDANPNLAGNQALGANQAVFFGWNGGRYVSVNDGLAPFNTNTDLVINVTGMTGTMPTGALTPTNYFAV
jgi:Ca2+-binding RTX toxin-like protein